MKKGPTRTRVIILKYAHKHITLDGKLSEAWIRKKCVQRCIRMSFSNTNVKMEPKLDFRNWATFGEGQENDSEHTGK